MIRNVSSWWHIVAPLAALVWFVAPVTNAQSTTAASVVVPDHVSFGTVRPGSKHTANFVIKNLANRVVRVERVIPSCKCTEVGLKEGTTIAVGEELSWQATLSVPTTPGDKEAKIMILLNDGHPPLAAQMTAVAALPIVATPAYIDALKGVTEGTVVVKSEDGTPFRILSVDGQAAEYVGFDSAADEPRPEYTLRWRFVGPSSGDPRLWWVVATDREDSPIVALRVRNESTGSKADMARFQRYWWIPEQIVVAGRVGAGKSVPLSFEMQHYNPNAKGTVTLPNWNKGVAVRITDATSTATLIEARNAGENVLVTFQWTPSADTRGFVFAQLEVRTETGVGFVPVVAWVEP